MPMAVLVEVTLGPTY